MKVFLTVALAITVATTYAQDLSDGVLFSQDNIIGTARYNALGGAFNSLGGDLSAVSLNPASSSVFERSQGALTLLYSNINNETRYFNNTISTDDDSFDFSQAGAVFVFNNRNQNSKWRKFALGVNYDLVDVYDDTWIANGTSANSIDSYFLNFAEGKRLGDISRLDNETFSEAYREIGNAFGYGHQQAFLGFESFILEPGNFNDDNTVYTSNIAPGTFNQDYIFNTQGYNSKISFNASAQYDDRLYIGLNLNSHYFNYRRSVNLFESNANIGSNINEVEFETALQSTGYGFSFQLGTILKLTNQLRAGFTYNSPTWFNIEEENSQFIETFSATDNNIGASIFPGIINIFPRYKLKTPGRFTGGLSYVFGQNGLLSVDYSLKDYSNLEFTDDLDPNFNAQNQRANIELKSASTINVGGEYRYDMWRFRAGYSYQESPYKTKQNGGIGDVNSYALGLGYNFNTYLSLDFSYNHSNQINQNQLFSTGLTNTAQVDANRNRFILSLNYSL